MLEGSGVACFCAVTLALGISGVLGGVMSVQEFKDADSSICRPPCIKDMVSENRYPNFLTDESEVLG